MAETTTLQPIQTDTWVKASWEAFIATAYSPDYHESRAYYNQGYMRLEMAPLGTAHGKDNSLIAIVVTVYGIAKNLPIESFTNTSFRKIGVRECQPDLAYYIGSSIPALPRSNAPIDVDTYGPPDLVVEIGASSFSDDLGAKRLLYEQLGVQEYWVVNTAGLEVIAFEVTEGYSGRIATSQALPNLEMTLVNEALGRSASEDNSTIGRWLLAQFGNP